MSAAFENRITRRSANVGRETPFPALRIIGVLTLLGVSLSLGPECDGTDLTVLHSFAGGINDGTSPGPLVQDGSGILYGVTGGGGTSDLGTVFKLKADGTGFAVLHSFASGTGSGSNPTGLVLDGAGYLYGTRSVNDAASDSGVVFRIRTDGTGYSILHTFKGGANDGASPQASLAFGGSGNLFGTTSGGGSAGFGTVFRLKTDGTGFAILHSFTNYPTDGAGPMAPVILDGAGNLYGTTLHGGSARSGVVFKVRNDGIGYSILHNFMGGGDGINPFSALVLDAAGDLFGTTFGTADGQIVPGFGMNYGTVFNLKTDGTGYFILHTFTGGLNDGSNPYSAPALDGLGNLYGTTHQGGASNRGVIYSLRTVGTGFAILHNFTGVDGTFPVAGIILDSAGNLYGTTVQGGTSNRGVVYLLGYTSTPPAATWLLPSSAHSSGFNGAFYTTDLTVSNTGPADGTITVKFLGHDLDGQGGAEVKFAIGSGGTLVLADVLGSAFGVSSGYGALLISSNVTTLSIEGETSTPAPACVGGTFGQSVPAVGSAGLIPGGVSRSISGIRENSAFRTNLILANASDGATDVSVSLLLGDGTLAGTKKYHIEALGMHQVTQVVRDLGVTSGVSGAQLVLTPVSGVIAAYASAIDNLTNDPRTLLPQ